MTRGRRRSAVLLGLALLLGGLAASDVAGRERALQEALGPTVPVVVARGALPAGTTLEAKRLAIRQVPSRYAPAGAFRSVGAVAGLKTAAKIPDGADIVAGSIEDGAAAAGAPVRAGERVAELVARGSAQLIRPGGRVDVLVTRERGDDTGATTVALENAEVLSVRAITREGEDAEKVSVALRVKAKEAVYLTAAQSFARELRILPRAAGDDSRGLAGTTVGSDLR